MDHQFGKPLLYTSKLFNICVILKGRIKKLATKMVITSGNEEDKGSQEKESKEETILAMLGIIGTILNLIVIIFVYIYTTL
ncbi:protein TUNAR isoform X1 [Strix aluco]|uniref:protein TUNAR isoform X1 n=1 Tax=Strix aluco TaxID=111821 RepID=UPI003DA1DC5C